MNTRRFIAFTTIALFTFFAAPSNAEGPKLTADPFAGDRRIASRRTVRVHDQPMGDFLADLTEQTGVRFYADSSVADDRVTVFSHDRPVGEALKALADFLGFEWRRDSAGKPVAYTLYQPPARLAAEEEVRRLRAATT